MAFHPLLRLHLLQQLVIHTSITASVNNLKCQILGFIGDMIGYRMVLIFNVLMAATFATSFNFLPVYKELEQVPHGLLYMNVSAAESTGLSFDLMSVQWPLCQDSFTAGKRKSL